MALKLAEIYASINLLEVFGMKKKLPILFVVMLCVTFVSHILFFYFGTATNLAKGTQFHDYDSFIAYMEQDNGSDNGVTANETRTPLRIDDGTPDGKVICEFYFRNMTVGAILPADNEDGLPLTVYSREEFEAAFRMRNTINWIIVALYPVELLAAVVVARKTREQKTH